MEEKEQLDRQLKIEHEEQQRWSRLVAESFDAVFGEGAGDEVLYHGTCDIKEALRRRMEGSRETVDAGKMWVLMLDIGEYMEHEDRCRRLMLAKTGIFGD